MNSEAQRLIEALQLAPHPEGGFFRETFRSQQTVERLLDGRQQTRSALTCIDFLLLRGQVSRWHVVQSDEAWQFCSGEPLELITYDPSSRSLERLVLGRERDQTSITVVPARVWQAARPLGSFALCACTVGPGFEFDDFAFVADLDDAARHFDNDLSEFRPLL